MGTEVPAVEVPPEEEAKNQALADRLSIPIENLSETEVLKKILDRLEAIEAQLPRS